MKDKENKSENMQKNSVEEMCNEIINIQKQKRTEYCIRLQKAFEYKGNNDHEDIPSILKDYEDLIMNRYYKDSVVLSREEYYVIDHNIKHLETVCNNLEKERNTLEEKIMDLRLEKHELMNKISEKDNKIALLEESIDCIKFNVDFTRKETAEKILQFIYDRVIDKHFIKKAEELAKQFGVEIKE